MSKEQKNKTWGTWGSGINYSSAGASGLCTLTTGDYVWLSCKNYSGTGDITIRSANVNLHRLI